MNCFTSVDSEKSAPHAPHSILPRFLLPFIPTRSCSQSQIPPYFSGVCCLQQSPYQVGCYYKKNKPTCFDLEKKFIKRMWGNSQKYQEGWILVSPPKSGSPIHLYSSHLKLYHHPVGPVRTLLWDGPHALNCTACALDRMLHTWHRATASPSVPHAADTAAGENSLLFLLLCVPFQSLEGCMESIRPKLLIANDAVRVPSWQFQLRWWELTFTCDQNSRGIPQTQKVFRCWRVK